MFVDATQLSQADEIECDLCIVGAGAAGITLARSFIDSAIKVVVLEGGGREFDPDSQALYRGRSVGFPYHDLETARLRFLGGTTNHWSGWCRPLEPSDFEPKPWAETPGWPISYADLAPYYEQALPVVELPQRSFDIADWERLDSTSRLKRMPVAASRFGHSVFQFSPPTRFGEEYEQELSSAPNIQIYLNATALELVQSENGGTITQVRAATLSGNRLSVKPRFVVVACGGIENARLLLLSNRTESAGVGNRHDLVGRYFADHVELASGYALFNQPLGSFAWYVAGEEDVTVALRLEIEQQRARSCLACNFTFHQVMDEAETSEGFGSLRRIVRSLQRRQMPDDLLGDLSNVVVDTRVIAEHVLRRVRRAPFDPRFYLLMNRIEVAPNRESRVTLDQPRDALGQNMVKLDWRLSAIDKVTVAAAQEELGLAFGEAELGRVRAGFRAGQAWPTASQGGFHHMGTTRMSDDPRSGVVDANCRVHDVANLWIAGSSVFPSTGTANPTLTIVALALRLADHLKGKMT